jgi:hypothetical protein
MAAVLGLADATVNQDGYEDVSNGSGEELSEACSVKIVHSHSNFGPHPYDLGLNHSHHPVAKTKQLFDAYVKGYLVLNRYYY